MKSYRFGAAVMCAALIAVPLAPGVGPASAAQLDLAVLSPAPDSITESPSVIISGNVTPGASVAVDGVLAHVDANGSWTVRIALAEGTNAVHVQAWDTDGNETNLTLSVTFHDRTSELEADLADALDEINATQEDLTRTQNDLAEAQADIADALAGLDELGLALDNTQRDLADVQADLADVQADLAEAQARLSQASGRVDTTDFLGGLALLIGVLGVALGAAGIAMGFWVGRRRVTADEDSETDRP
ncbi:MAG TPA: hypothetical protein VGB42_12280 [Candidatus Thermoplasmatota archaeon]